MNEIEKTRQELEKEYKELNHQKQECPECANCRFCNFQSEISMKIKGFNLGVELAQKEFLKWLEYECDDIGELFMNQHTALRLKTVKVHIRDKIEELKKAVEE